MANNTTAGTRTAPDIQRFREVVADVVGEVRSAEVRHTYVALSIEELVDQQIERLEAGASQDPMKPARMDRLQASYDAFKQSISAIKDLPPEMFTPADPNTGTNSPETST